MKTKNYMEVKFSALSENEGFARVCVAGFCLPLNPSIEELGDIKTAVSEAVTNCVVHAYPKGSGVITLSCLLSAGEVTITIKDSGIGIKDIARAREPFYTTKPDEERSGMGFAVMESFMDEVEVSENEGGGLVVVMKKKVSGALAKVENA